MNRIILVLLATILFSCNEKLPEAGFLILDKVEVGDIQVNVTGQISENLPVDRPITLSFTTALDPTDVGSKVRLLKNEQEVNTSISLNSNNRNIVIFPVGLLDNNTVYKILISNALKGANQSTFPGKDLSFKTSAGGIELVSIDFENSEQTKTGRTVNVPLDFRILLEFSQPVTRASFQAATKLTGDMAPTLQYVFSDNDKKVAVTGSTPLRDLTKYSFQISNALKSVEGGSFAGNNKLFFSSHREDLAFPLISDDELLTKVQEQTFRYFWDFGHPNSGMARERNTSGNLVTTGGTGFGLMSILVGIERGFVTREEGVARLAKIIGFLSTADRFHGAWSHWLDGNTGKVIPFSDRDNGGDLVETALLVQGMLTVREYLNESNPTELAIQQLITQLWEGVEWNWFTQGGRDILYWHWSPDFGWQMNLTIHGYNEALIVYVLAASSPTFPISKAVYEKGWATNGAIKNGRQFYGTTLPLGYDFGGPLFFAHYSFLGLDPRNLSDQFANYWEQNVNHSLINEAHAIFNPLGFAGYSAQSWGLTASDNHLGYNAHSPTNDLGVITPTAALSSFPYTPAKSMVALKFFYYKMGGRLWGQYGFYDAFNITEQWYADSFLAIDQGPIIVMIENHCTALLWNLFMKNPEIKTGLDKLGFSY